MVGCDEWFQIGNITNSECDLRAKVLCKFCTTEPLLWPF
jgi:hypothetical protein